MNSIIYTTFRILSLSFFLTISIAATATERGTDAVMGNETTGENDMGRRMDVTAGNEIAVDNEVRTDTDVVKWNKMFVENNVRKGTDVVAGNDAFESNEARTREGEGDGYEVDVRREVKTGTRNIGNNNGCNRDVNEDKDKNEGRDSDGDGDSDGDEDSDGGRNEYRGSNREGDGNGDRDGNEGGDMGRGMDVTAGNENWGRDRYEDGDMGGDREKDRTKEKEKKSREKGGDIIKTGYNFGPLPAIAYDADKGFQLGAILNIYDFGDGSTYPNTRQQWYLEASFFTKGSQMYTVMYDNKFLIPGVRMSTSLNIINDRAMDFYGFNGYRSYYDYERIQLGEDDPDMYLYTPYYRFDRLSVKFKTDFIGNIWDNKLFWIAGYHLAYFRQGDIDLARANKGKDENKCYPSDAPTLFGQYKKWGLIPENEAGGCLISMLRLGLMLDTRDKEAAPSKGLWVESHVILAPRWLGTDSPHYKWAATFRHYVPIVENDVLTLAYRINYEGTFGNNAPYYALPFLTIVGADYDKDGMGGFNTLRGVLRNRVQGLDMATYTVELRWRFVQFKLWKQNMAFAFNVFSDGSMVTKEYDMSFGKTAADFPSETEYTRALSEYEAYMAKGQPHDKPHITAGAGARFIMNDNFIVCLEYGLPVTRLRKQDGNGALYINIGYLF